ncbi:hypothetical protein [Planctomycetes bacterium Poly30]
MNHVRRPRSEYEALIAWKRAEGMTCKQRAQTVAEQAAWEATVSPLPDRPILARATAISVLDPGVSQRAPLAARGNH